MVSKVNCGITGSAGVLGSLFIKKYSFNFIKFTGNITNKNQVNRWVKENNFDLVLHFAAIVTTKNVNNNYKYALDINFQGTKNLIDAIVKNKNNIKWFFFSSTSHVYDYSKKKIKETDIIKPISKYGFTKFKAEIYIKNMSYKYNFKYCIGRIFSFSSPKQSSSFFVPSLKRRIMQTNKNIIYLENLNHYRDFISIKDVCRAIYFLWKKKFNGIINVASGNKFYLKNIAIKMAKKRNKKLFFLNNNEETALIADISKLKKLGWKPKYKNTFSGIF